MQSIHSCFKLKPSRIALVFQSSCMLMISFCFFYIFNLLLWIIAITVIVASYWVFLKQAKVERIEQLQDDIWSIQYRNLHKIQRSKMIRMIDHRLYIVIYLQDKKINPIVIWCDQVSEIEWKMLKIRTKLT